MLYDYIKDDELIKELLLCVLKLDTPETLFELLEFDNKDIIWDIDWCEGECYVDLNSIYIFEETQISEMIENHIELYEYVTEKRGTNL